ncbi:hypothetical protein DIJ64_12835 [Mycobacterium leprae]|uniref:Uncharacterized protein n=1 Tax=Mycobacterium leprae TaxID=1769 RepID=A0AAD0KX30_MYCLR|nr:hypothetical protein DIJ64_12835 [Mycobacterium leprae]
MFEAMFCYPGPTADAINACRYRGLVCCWSACGNCCLLSSDEQIGASEVRIGVLFPSARL